MGKLAFRDFGGLLVLVDEGFESSLGTELEIRKFVSELVDPGENVIVLLFVEMNYSFEVVHVAIEFEEHFFGVQKANAFLDMLIL